MNVHVYRATVAKNVIHWNNHDQFFKLFEFGLVCDMAVQVTYTLIILLLTSLRLFLFVPGPCCYVKQCLLESKD